MIPLTTLLACATSPTPEAADPRALMLVNTADTGATTIDPIAVGFEFDGIIRADGSITGYQIGGYFYDPMMRLVVADLDFFYTGDDSLTCSFYAFPYAPAPLACDLPNDDGVAAWNSYEATLALTMTDCGGLLDPVVQADLEDAFEGMRLGISFGPMTPYLEAAWDPATIAMFGPAMSAMYVSLVDPDGSWIGEDWTTGFSFALDPATGDPFVNAAGDLVSIPDVSTNDLTLDEAYVRTFAYWYQDFPLMDFLQLDDVNGPACDCTPDPGDTGLGLDGDGDGVCDALDPCPVDDPDDTDLDGVCDSDDACPLDDPDDTDGDGACESLDPCPADNPDDTDGDGVCQSLDPCPADNPDDTDGDGVCDSDDACPDDVADDTDGDGVCDSDDPCPVDNPDDPDGDDACGTAATTTDPPPPTTDGGGGETEEKGGCGCASHDPAGAGPIVALCAAIVLGGRARRGRGRAAGG